MSDPTTVVRQVEFISCYEELLAVTEPEAADLTRLEVVELPKTKALEDRYGIVVAGPAAKLLAQFLFGQAEAVFSAAKKDGSQPST